MPADKMGAELDNIISNNPFKAYLPLKTLCKPSCSY